VVGKMVKNADIFLVLYLRVKVSDITNKLRNTIKNRPATNDKCRPDIANKCAMPESRIASIVL
jgi:hypothetical protein